MENTWKSDLSKRMFWNALEKIEYSRELSQHILPENCEHGLIKLTYTKLCIKKSMLIAEEVPLNF